VDDLMWRGAEAVEQLIKNDLLSAQNAVHPLK